MKVKRWKLAAFLLPCLLLFALIYLIPLGMVFGSSFFEWKAGGVFNFVGLDNYINAFTNDPRMITALKNTVIWVLMQSTIHVGIGTVIAFMLARKMRGWKVMRTIYMFPNVVSAAALGVIFLNVFNPKYGLINSFISQITGNDFVKNWFFDQNSAFITVTWSWLLYTGMIIIIVLAALLAIPEDVLEAARIDGASEYRIFFTIAMPAVKPAWLTLVIFTFQSMWNTTGVSYIYNESLKTLPSVLTNISTGGLARAGASAAVAVLLMIPPIAIFLISQSSVMETMSHSGLK